MSQEEKQEKIKEMVKQEKVLRSESKFTSMEKLIGPQAKVTYLISSSSVIIPPLRRTGGYTVLAPSVLPSVTNIFHHIFLSNHASQPLQTWYGASARGPTGCLSNLGPPVIYLLVYDLVYFLTSLCNQYFLSLFSQQPCIITTSNLVYCFG